MYQDLYLIEPIKEGQRVYDTYWLHAMSSYVRERLDLDGAGVLMPVINQSSVEIGKHQNVLQEVNLTLLEAKQIQLLRRRAGGGAIYYDTGCLALWFKAPDEGEGQDHFVRVTEPVVAALKELGATGIAKTGRNDLTIAGKKVSGTAVFVKDGYAGGGVSLMLDVDFDTLDEILTPNIKKLKSKGIKSTRSRVTAIRPYLAPEFQTATIEEFKNLVLEKLYAVDSVAEIKQYHLTNEDWQIIEKDFLPAYQDWEWNYGANPKFEYNRDAHFKAGTIEFSLQIAKGRIAACKIYGDFFGRKEISEVEAALIGVRLHREDLLAVFEQLDVPAYFGAVTAAELVTLILS